MLSRCVASLRCVGRDEAWGLAADQTDQQGHRRTCSHAGGMDGDPPALERPRGSEAAR